MLTGVVSAAEAEANPVSVDPWQAIYTIVVFLCLMAILAKFGFKPILLGLKRREDFIRTSLDEARKAREQAEASLKEYEAKLDRARGEATAIVDEAHRAAEALRRHIEQEARASSDAIVDRAKREINLARDHALQSLFARTVELAASLAAAALRRQMSPEEHQRLVHDALHDLQERERTAN